MGNSRFFLVEHRLFLSAAIVNIIEDTHVFEVQRFFNDLIGIDTACSVGVICLYVSTVVGFVCDNPFARHFYELDLDLSSHPTGSAEQFIHKVLHVLLRHPYRAELNTDFRSS